MTINDDVSTTYVRNYKQLMYGQRVAYVIEAKGISKAWIADKLGISKQALNYILRHSVKPKFIDEFAELLSVNPQWLENGIGEPVINNDKKNINSKTHSINITTKLDLLDNQDLYRRKRDIVSLACDNPASFIAYKLDDNSNFPPFITNSILIFNTQKKPVSTDYVLIKIYDDIFVRQYIADGKNICYKSNNSDHKTFINPEEIKILGVLVEARYKIN